MQLPIQSTGVNRVTWAGMGATRPGLLPQQFGFRSVRLPVSQPFGVQFAPPPPVGWICPPGSDTCTCTPGLSENGVGDCASLIASGACEAHKCIPDDGLPE